MEVYDHTANKKYGPDYKPGIIKPADLVNGGIVKKVSAVYITIKGIKTKCKNNQDCRKLLFSTFHHEWKNKSSLKIVGGPHEKKYYGNYIGMPVSCKKEYDNDKNTRI